MSNELAVNQPTTDKDRRFLFPIDKIKDADRIRTDYSHVPELAASMQEHGLLQPIVIQLDGTLIAGGSRLRAAKSLGWLLIPVNFFEVLDPVTARILEVEENIRRKAMTWQERVMAVADIHNKQTVIRALKGEKWIQRETGAMLGCSQADVSYSLLLAERIRVGDKEVIKAEKMWDAIGLLVKRAADDSNKALAKLTLPSLDPSVATKLLTEANLDDSSIFSPVAETVGGVAGLSDDGEMPNVAAAPEAIVVPLSRMCIRQDGGPTNISIIQGMTTASVDHVITDWPFGNEMENIQQSGAGMDVSATAAEHDVANVRMLHFKIIPEIFRVIKPGGFFMTFFDLSLRPDELAHTLKVMEMIESVGFKIQAWPNIWHKTHRCQNTAASFNFTKNYESVLIARKEGGTLLAPQESSVYLGGTDEDTRALKHPFAKPAKLWQWLYAAVAHKGQLVLDPFAGVGSSTLAALQFGLQPIAIECNESHHAALVVNVSEHYRRTLKNVKFV